MYGWKGKILHINLTHEKFSIEHPSLHTYEKYIGGKGLAGYYLKNHISKKWNSPDMPLIFFTGPLCDTMTPASGRMTVMSRSPLTGTVGDTSVGGKLGINIKKAGFDGIILSGRCNKYSGIEINESEICFKNSESLKGLTVSETLSKLDKIGSTAIIGPAAENGVMFASIMIDGHFAAGRNGLGLVMASKNLKYLKVSGSGKTEIYNPEELQKAREEIFRLASASPALTGELGISNYGTGALYDLMDSRRMMPTENFSKTFFNNAINMNAWHYKQKYGYKKTGCAGCTIQCKKLGRNKEVIPEFETMSHFSALLGNNCIETIAEANRVCNEFGMDTISAAVTLACYQEIEKVKFTPEKILKLLNDIVYGSGIGAELKMGSYKFAESRNCPELSMSVKRQEIPGYDPRGAYGIALAYATSTRGACHLRAYPISHEILRKPVVTDRFSFSGKARIIKISEDIFAAVDSLTTCKFLFFAASLEEYAKAFHGVTGIKTTAQDLMKCGERIYYNERIMNSMNCFTSKDDELPKRFFEEPGSSGNSITVNPIDRNEFLEARSNYYKVRGLTQNGMPTETKIKELDLL
ncbi:MAG TPA: aldehyde ferredoxin oxidoreductase family protein [Victivallales bacterium]|nr:aldehyde ferredoxin oxidoreductase family protein [Victivallales bacterium]